MSDLDTEIIRRQFPIWDNVAAFEFNVDNHLDRYGTPTAAKTITFLCEMKDGKKVRITIE